MSSFSLTFQKYSSFCVHFYSIAPGEARNIKATGVQLHALGIQLGKDIGYTNNNSDTYLTDAQVRARMSLLASTGLYQDAASASDVQKYLKEQANSVVSTFNTVNNGVISDPLGTQFIYNGTNADVTSVGSSGLSVLPTAQMTNNSLSLSNVTLGKNQEIQIHYQIRLNTESSNFVPEHWYQMNGRTTFTPNGSNPDNIVDFGIPSAKGLGVTLNFTKIWEEYDNDSSGRPQNVTFEVQRNKTTMPNVWQKGYINVLGTKEQNTWIQTSNKISEQKNGSSTLWLPKYNTQGEEIKYTITNETAVPGYDSTKVNDVTYKNTKQFIPLSLEITKENGLGEKLKGAKFKLIDSKETEILGEVDSSGTIFTYKNLKVGKYYLQEVEAPEGYAILKKNMMIEILTNGLVKVDNESVKVENHTIKLTVNNQKVGTLPATGGPGYGVYWILSFILFTLFLIMGIVYLLRIKNNSK